jgi:hypothetical protein
MSTFSEKKSKGVHGKPGVVGIFKVDTVIAAYQKPRQTYRPPNYLSAPIPGAPILSNLSVYRLRTDGAWVLTIEEQRTLLLFARDYDLRNNSPSPPVPLWPPRATPEGYQYCRWRKNWRKLWRRDRGQGIWPEPERETMALGRARGRTSGPWAKDALALHFHKLALKLSSKRCRRHLPVDDRIAAALLGFSEAIHRFDPATHTNGLTAYAIWWIRKELQRLAKNERRQPQGEHRPYGFGEGEFGLGIPMSFRPRAYPLIRYDENSYRRRPQYVNIGDCVVENIKLGAPADDNDDVEHAGPSFANWSPVNPETTLLFKEAAWEKYNGRSAEEIAQMLRDDKEIKLARGEGRYSCDASTVIDAAAVNATRRDWRARKNRKRLAIASPTPPKALAVFVEMASLPASVFAPV